MLLSETLPRLPIYNALLGCNSRTFCLPTNKFFFSDYKVHPLYFPVQIPGIGIANDVSLIKLKVAFNIFTYPKTVRPVCLPTLPMSPLGFQYVIATGWGVGLFGSPTDLLREVSCIMCSY
jgi:hypothetical protein